MAKRNLQKSQSKMKVWYDRKTKSRCFEPGDRILVLFPVVGNPLQAKYSGARFTNDLRCILHPKLGRKMIFAKKLRFTKGS